MCVLTPPILSWESWTVWGPTSCWLWEKLGSSLDRGGRGHGGDGRGHGGGRARDGGRGHGAGQRGTHEAPAVKTTVEVAAREEKQRTLALLNVDGGRSTAGLRSVPRKARPCHRHLTRATALSPRPPRGLALASTGCPASGGVFAQSPHILVLWLWEGHFTSPCLSFLVWKSISATFLELVRLRTWIHEKHLGWKRSVPPSLIARCRSAEAKQMALGPGGAGFESWPFLPSCVILSDFLNLSGP